MGTNLYGYIPGRVDSFIVISAHLRSWGISKNAGGADSIFNGADDNASGVATLLAIAKYFKEHPPKYHLYSPRLMPKSWGCRAPKHSLPACLSLPVRSF